MGWLRKKPDPIGERERKLDARIAELEGRIQQLNQRIAEDQAQPKLRSTALPHAQPVPPAGQASGEPAFEELTHLRVGHAETQESTAAHYNDLGVRKYDPLATLRRWWRQLRGAPAPNPKLVSYLAAGSIHGLRPLRYEKRVARNRFLALCAFFVLVLWGLIYLYFRHR
jgi:hypothetical protein